MIFKVIMSLIFAGASAILYRMGGSGKFNTKARDFGVPIVMIAMMWLWGMLHWSLFFCFGLMFGAMTTYWDFVNHWIMIPDPDREYSWNWFLHGFFGALAMFPVVWALDLWPGFWIRNIIVAFLIAVWSEKNGNAVWEECGRGFIFIITIPLLLI